MLIINNRFLNVYDYNFLLVIEKIMQPYEKEKETKIKKMRIGCKKEM